MKRKITLFLVLLSCTIGAYSQTPGYLGKRLLVAGEFGSVLKILPQPNHNFNPSYFNFSIRGIFDLDYVTSRRSSIGLTINMVNTSTEFSYDSISRTKGLETHFADFAQIKGLSYCLNFKIFHNRSRGSIAPIGTYSKIGMGILRYKTTPYISELAYLDKTNSESFTLPLITYAYGKQRVFFNNFIFRTAVEVGFIPGGLLSAYRYYVGDTDEYGGVRIDEIKTVSKIRLSSYYLVNFNIGVGFLLPVRGK